MRVGAAATQGTRQAMEDAHVAVLDLRSHPGFPSSADTLARAFFGVRSCCLVTDRRRSRPVAGIIARLA